MGKEKDPVKKGEREPDVLVNPTQLSMNTTPTLKMTIAPEAS